MLLPRNPHTHSPILLPHTCDCADCHMCDCTDLSCMHLHGSVTRVIVRIYHNCKMYGLSSSTRVVFFLPHTRGCPLTRVYYVYYWFPSTSYIDQLENLLKHSYGLSLEVNTCFHPCLRVLLLYPNKMVAWHLLISHFKKLLFWPNGLYGIFLVMNSGNVT